MWTLSENKTWAHLAERFDWVARMTEVPQDSRYHAEGNVAIHTQMVIAALINTPYFKQLDEQEQEMLWASALLHDVEKYGTTMIEADGSITSIGHARKGAMTARQIIYRELPAPFFIREQVVGLVRHHGLPLWVFEKPDPLKALIMASYEVNTQWLALLARADVLGRICDDQAEMLYKIDCFEELCREHHCWGAPRAFPSANARVYYMQKQDDAYADYIPFDEPEFEVILMSGLPGAGKDTFIKKHYPKMTVISLDAIRIAHKISPTDKSGNGWVIQEAKEQARVLLRKKQSFIWNGTNITVQMRTQIIALFNTYRASVKIIYIEVPYSVLLNQNAKREAMLPMSAMEKLISKLEIPALWEAHDIEYQTM